jgi:hypothetical protein
MIQLLSRTVQRVDFKLDQVAQEQYEGLFRFRDSVTLKRILSSFVNFPTRGIRADRSGFSYFLGDFFELSLGEIHSKFLIDYIGIIEGGIVKATLKSF